jgi:hypothetical protein
MYIKYIILTNIYKKIRIMLFLKFPPDLVNFLHPKFLIELIKIKIFIFLFYNKNTINYFIHNSYYFG